MLVLSVLRLWMHLSDHRANYIRLFGLIPPNGLCLKMLVWSEKPSYGYINHAYAIQYNKHTKDNDTWYNLYLFITVIAGIAETIKVWQVWFDSSLWKLSDYKGPLWIYETRPVTCLSAKKKTVWAASIRHFTVQSLQDSSIYFLNTAQTGFKTKESGKYIWHKYFFLFE